MKKSKSVPKVAEQDVLTIAAIAIGSTLGSLAKRVGLAAPKKAVKRKAARKVAIKKTAAKKVASKKASPIKKAAAKQPKKKSK